eukprot:2894080-Rhodomonas_salina.1
MLSPVRNAFLHSYAMRSLVLAYVLLLAQCAVSGTNVRILHYQVLEQTATRLASVPSDGVLSHGDRAKIPIPDPLYLLSLSPIPISYP